ncbi:DUF5320 domain-containing protein [Candidatus Fermentibacterales bacterium]|nr:DUF5320 domain-containing protein [Candidatus Fermentibacterales bacterium]
MGPMTGRAMGYCAGYPAPGYASGPRWGGFNGGARFGGMRGGRGWRNQYYASGGVPGWIRFGYAPAAVEPQGELGMLRSRAEWLSEQLDLISARIGEIEKTATDASKKKGAS